MPRASAIVDPRIGDLGPALLALEDGSIFDGVAFGAPVAGGGDLVVNTSQTGYQEVCTDPSYAGQVVVMTYPLIGNYGRLLDDDQSARPWLRGLVVANATAAVLDDARQLARLLRDTGIPAIAGVDTRALARHLRANGSLRGVILEPGALDREAATARAPGRAALGGPGLRRRGVAGRGRSSIGAGEAGPARRDRRLRPQGEHRAQPPAARRAGPGPAAHRERRRRSSPSDVAGVVLSPGPGDPARLAGPSRWRGP